MKTARFVNGAHHNDFALVAGARYWTALQAFGQSVAARVATP
ncbi:MAG: hypothetical protein ABI601_20045 [bacterium]